MKILKFNYANFAAMLFALFLTQFISCQETSNEIIDDVTVSTEQVKEKEFQPEIRFVLPEHITAQGEEKISEFLSNMTGEDLTALAENRRVAIYLKSQNLDDVAEQVLSNGLSSPINIKERLTEAQAQELESYIPSPESASVMACRELKFVTIRHYCRPGPNGTQVRRCGNVFRCNNGYNYYFDKYICIDWTDYGYCPSSFPVEYCGAYIYPKMGKNEGLKNVTEFMQREIDNNLDVLVKLYITNKTEIDAALEQENMAAPLEAFYETNAGLYYRGFAEGQELNIKQNHIDAARTFLTNLNNNLSSNELKTEINALVNTLDATNGQELKTAIKTLDDIKR